MRAQLLSVAQSPAQACQSWTLATTRSVVVPMSSILYSVLQIFVESLNMTLSSRVHCQA